MGPMERFSELISPKTPQTAVSEIAKELVTEAVSMKKSKMKLDRFDWNREQGCDPRDVRAVGEPCMGRHSIAPFARQSLSGSNGHAVWIACSRCALRLLYVPTHGAPAMYRSAGPLLEDTRAKLTQVPNATAEELTTKAIALDGAEASALQNLKKIKGQKASLQKEKETMGYKDQSKPEPKAKISPTDVPAVDLTSEGPMPVETGSKKVTMREHTLPAEQQEQETAQGFEVIAS